MSIRRICNHFNYLDSAYSLLYEAEIEFEKNPNYKTKSNLDNKLQFFTKKVSDYKISVKELYFIENN